MTAETESLNAKLTTAQIFSRLLPDTAEVGTLQDKAPQDSREAALRNHAMVRRNYESPVSGDGACAGCGEKVRSACSRIGHRSLHADRFTTARPTVCLPRPTPWNRSVLPN